MDTCCQVADTLAAAAERWLANNEPKPLYLRDALTTWLDTHCEDPDVPDTPA